LYENNKYTLDYTGPLRGGIKCASNPGIGCSALGSPVAERLTALEDLGFYKVLTSTYEYSFIGELFLIAHNYVPYFVNSQ